MAQIPRSRLIAYVAGTLIVLAVGTWSLRGAGPDAPEAGRDSGAARDTMPRAAANDAGAVAVEAPPAPSPVVHVAGAVRRTGVYRLPDGSRVKDAVERAGGATADANLDGINLAAKVADGQQVVVPEKVAAVAAAPPPEGTAGDADPGAATGAAPALAAPVGLNAATLEQLQTLDGVGPATAEKIVSWRTEHGGFRSVDDLGQVPGIGPKRLAALRDHVQP